jgi:hypothetical protein
MADPGAATASRPQVSLAAWARRASVQKRLDGLPLARTPAALLVWSITRGSLRVTRDSTLIRLRPGSTVAVDCSGAGGDESRALSVSAGVVTCTDASGDGAGEMVLEVSLRRLRDGRTRRPAQYGLPQDAFDRLIERLGGGPGWVRANLPDDAVQRLRACTASGALSVVGSNFVVRVDGSKGVTAHCEREDTGTGVVVVDDRSIRCAGSGEDCGLTLEIPHGSWRVSAA